MLKSNDYCGFIREKQEKIKTKRSCYSNDSVRLIIVNSNVVEIEIPVYVESRFIISEQFNNIFSI